MYFIFQKLTPTFLHYTYICNFSPTQLLFIMILNAPYNLPQHITASMLMIRIGTPCVYEIMHIRIVDGGLLSELSFFRTTKNYTLLKRLKPIKQGSKVHSSAFNSVNIIEDLIYRLLFATCKINHRKSSSFFI